MPVSQLPPTDLIQEKLLFGVTPAAVAAAAVFSVGAVVAWVVLGVWRRWNWRRAIPSLAVAAFAAGVAAVPVAHDSVERERKAAREAGDDARATHLAEAYKFQESFPLVPDGKWWHWGLFAVGLAVAVELVARQPGVPVAAGNLLRGAAAGVIAAAVLPPDWQKGSDRWTLPLTAGVMAAQWGMLDAVSRRNPGGALAACLSVVALGVACVAIHDSSARFTDFMTTVAVPLAVLAVGGWVLRADVGSAAAVAVVPLLTALLATAEDRQKVPAAAYWLVGLAPLVLGLFLIPPVARFGTRWYSTPVKVLLVLIPLGIAVYLCVTQAPMTFEKEPWE